MVTMLHPSRRSAVAPFLAMDVMSAAASRERDGARIIHMEVGEPGAPAPLSVRAVAARAIEQGRIGYTEALGMPALRARIARHYGEWYRQTIDPERVIVTTGSSGGFILAFLALFDAGARVAIAAPGYPAYRNILQALGIEVVSLPTSRASRYVVDAAAIRRAHAECRIDGVLLMSPANPSGTMMSPEDLASVALTCDELGIRFISDEIYHGLTYEEPAETALKFSADAVVVNSFSKYFCMTGWRIGWLIVPDLLVRTMERLQQNLSISVPTLSQIAALAAFDAQAELNDIRQGYAASRAILLGGLPEMGFADIHPVDGAFYVYADIGRFTNDSVEFCRRMLNEAGVAATPGVDFDPDRGHRTLRLSFAGQTAEIAEAVQRIGAWLPPS
ncbi:pyridoxal phosphate-dependent aminotransferase [Lichenifustis flavocetrariae]|uniref:aspartate transaminase n=1 Tax=Lichenifustis flavocetrariae TaxID=2949735 RepID=A0AA41YRD0_9HYPH|nr:aminotransferase class I/II-fold pyridoxal phosphate-dependent enzyme [Lichenifustis flavocetrariae]MCW6507154.1 aminotransferase class I/II-fold pyridoxal phosphate-dependent enzyme [Lichenifustis flavocetrariae]